MIFAGISRKVTDILTDVGESFFQQNGRMLVDQELQRRHGFAASSLPQASGKIIGIACAYTPNGPVVITQTAGILIGTRNPLAKWTDIQLRQPIGGACAIYAPMNASGVFSQTVNFLLPLQSCLGTCVVSGSDVNRIAPFYGYSFLVRANGVIILSTGCFVNAGTSVAIPPGTTTLQVIVTGGCSGAGSPGSWSIGVTTP